jgi:micrococcal nuclease
MLAHLSSSKMLRHSLPILLAVLLPAGCSAQQPARASSQSCTIQRISDGDSFRCTDGRRVRLIGIDSPELGQGPFGPQAREALLTLLPLGTTVRLEMDASPSDRYGRQLAYAWSGATLVNESMVRNGWAVIYTVPPNVKYAERLAVAQKEARARGTGLWSGRGFECLPSDFRQGRCVTPP